MNIGFTVDKFNKFSITSVLKIFKWLGINSFEFTTSLYDEFENVLPLMENTHIRLHLPNFGGHGYDFSSKLFTDNINNDIDKIKFLCKKFNFSHAVFHPPEGPDNTVSKELLWKRLRQIPVPLLLENISSMSSDNFYLFFEEAEKELTTNLAGICFDIPHAFVAGVDWKEMFKNLKNSVKEIHLSDCYRTSDQHLPFGMGVLSLSEIINFLNEHEFKGEINFEIKPPSVKNVCDLLKTYKTSVKFTRGRLKADLRFKIPLLCTASYLISLF